MVTAVKPAYDVGGFKRLSDVRFKKRAEAREEKRLDIAEKGADQRYRLGQLQIEQTESNLQKIKRQSDLRAGLGKALSNIPEGENQFTTAYNYYMMQDAPDMAQKYMDSQSDRIDKIFKMSPDDGVKIYNDTIGKVQGITLKAPIDDKKYGKVFPATDQAGNDVFLQMVDDKPKVIEGYSPSKKDQKTTDIKEYEYAKENSGFDGSLKDWKTKAGKAKDPKFGWVTKSNGSKIWEELKEGTVSEAQSKVEDVKKVRTEMKDLQSRIYRVKSKEGLMDMIMENPEFAESFKSQFGNPESKKAKERYLTFLENQLSELELLHGENYGGDLPKEKQKPDLVYNPETGKIE